MSKKMATVDKAKELLEELRGASWNAAVQGIFLVKIIWPMLDVKLLYISLKGLQITTRTAVEKDPRFI